MGVCGFCDERGNVSTIFSERKRTSLCKLGSWTLWFNSGYRVIVGFGRNCEVLSFIFRMKYYDTCCPVCQNNTFPNKGNFYEIISIEPVLLSIGSLIVFRWSHLGSRLEAIPQKPLILKQNLNNDKIVQSFGPLKIV